MSKALLCTAITIRIEAQNTFARCQASSTITNFDLAEENTE